jgi:glucose/arabinose dehydrogenase
MRFFKTLIVLAAVSMASICRAADELPKIRLEPFLKGLVKPIYITNDRSDRLFIIEQDGRLRLYQNGQLEKKPFLDVTKIVNIDYECGLLGVAFHPDFAKNGYIYVDYTEMKPQLRTVIAEFHVDPKSDTVDVATERVLLRIDQPFNNHNGGHIDFGPDGYLYIAMGDGGNMHDPFNNAQNPKKLLGKILRIDVNKRDGYAIPADNPFVGKPEYAPEIYTLGMRNPWRFSFDRVTGLIYEADVGQDDWEEINIIQKGGNYGWRIREGKHDLHAVPNPPKMIDPIFEYNHEKTAASITGGYVYRGKAIPSLVGWYLFGDYSTGKIFGLKYEDGKVVANGMLINPKDTTRPENKAIKNIQPAAFGEDAAGEMFMCDITGGVVYRIVGQ